MPNIGLPRLVNPDVFTRSCGKFPPENSMRKSYDLLCRHLGKEPTDQFFRGLPIFVVAKNGNVYSFKLDDHNSDHVRIRNETKRYGICFVVGTPWETGRLPPGDQMLTLWYTLKFNQTKWAQIERDFKTGSWERDRILGNSFATGFNAVWNIGRTTL